VQAGLVPLLNALREDGTPPDAAWLSGSFDVAQQAALCSSIAEQLGFDMQRGRLDVSVHPFTGGSHPSDVRMTTRFKPNDLTEGLTGAGAPPHHCASAAGKKCLRVRAGRQKRVLARGTAVDLCGVRVALGTGYNQSWRGNPAGVTERRRSSSPTRNRYRAIRKLVHRCMLIEGEAHARCCLCTRHHRSSTTGCDVM
jgi:hypothetical protein